MASTIRYFVHPLEAGDAHTAGIWQGYARATLASGGKVDGSAFSFAAIRPFSTIPAGYESRWVYVGAVSPIALRVRINASDAVPDLDVITAIEFVVRAPGSSVDAIWSSTPAP